MGQATRRDRPGLRGLAETGTQSGRLLQGRRGSALKVFHLARSHPCGACGTVSLSASGLWTVIASTESLYGDTWLTDEMTGLQPQQANAQN